MDGNELRPLQAPLKKRYREQFRWDSEFESGFLQRGVSCEPDFLPGAVDWPTGHWSATRCFPLKATLFGRPSTDNGRPTYRDGSGNVADRPKSLHIALHGAGTRQPFGEMPPMRP